jgi:Gene product 88
MRDTVPGTTVALLGYTSKMECPSFGLPARVYCPGRPRSVPELGILSPCDLCYAFDRGNYKWGTVKHAQQVRADYVVASLKTPAGRADLTARLTKAIRYEVDRNVRRGGHSKFRMHDAADFFSPAYVRVWVDVCTALPDVRFWAPTQSYRLEKILAELKDLHALPNVCISPSGPAVDGAIPLVDGLGAGSVVVTLEGGALERDDLCPAFAQDGHCGGCMRCYDKAAERAYLEHNDTRAALALLPMAA